MSPQLFEEVSRENSQLQSQLQDTQRVVSQTRVELEKATQVMPHTPKCPLKVFALQLLCPSPQRPFWISQYIYMNSLVQLCSRPGRNSVPVEKIA